jgi:hypothetical protein
MGLDAFDPARRLVKQLDHRIEALRIIVLDDRFHRAVVAIPNLAANPKQDRGAVNECPKTDTLNSATACDVESCQSEASLSQSRP